MASLHQHSAEPSSSSGGIPGFLIKFNQEGQKQNIHKKVHKNRR